MKDICNKFGEYYDEGDEFLIKGIEGICFELEDIENRCFMENAGKLNIYICEYDDTNMFVVVKRGNDNLFMAMGICQFLMKWKPYR